MHPRPVLAVSLLAATCLLPMSAGAQAVSFAAGELTRIRLGPLVFAPQVVDRTFADAVTGHFGGMNVRDAVVLAGTTPVLVTAPGIMRSAVGLPVPIGGFDRSDVRAIATVRGAGENGLDALALVTGAGLWLWHKDLGASSPGTYVVDQPSPVAFWQGVTRLRTADVDGDGDTDILGMNGDRVRCIRQQATKPWPQWTIDTNAPVHDFLVADVIPGGTPEVVVLNGDRGTALGGVRVYQQSGASPGSGSPIQSFVWSAVGGVLSTFIDGGETMLLAAGRFDATDKLRIFGSGPAGLILGASSPTLAGEPTAIAAGPWRNPPAVDAVITLANQPNPVVVRYLGEPTPNDYQLGSPQVVSVTTTAPTAGYRNEATPLIADFHGDPSAPPERQGNPKLLYPFEALGVAEPAAIAMQCDLDWPRGQPRFADGDGSLRSVYNEVRGVPDGATHLSMLSWAIDLTPANPASRKARVELLDETIVPLTDEGDGTWTTTLDVPGLPHTEIWALMVRFVRIEDKVLVHRWPARAAMAMPSHEVPTYGQPPYLQLVWPMLRPIYGQGLSERQQEMFILHAGACLSGILGDVIQPPGLSEAEDEGDEPPQGSGG